MSVGGGDRAADTASRNAPRPADPGDRAAGLIAPRVRGGGSSSTDAGGVAAPFPAAIATGAGRIVHVNESMVRMLGSEWADVTSLAKLLNPPHGTGGPTAVAEAALSGWGPHERCYPRNDAPPVWALVTAVPTSSEPGGDILVQLVDISEQKRVQTEARDVAARQSALANFASRMLRGVTRARVLEDAVATAVAALESDLADVMELLPGGRTLATRAAIGWSTQAAGATVDVDRASRAGFAILGGRAVFTPDQSVRTTPAPHEREAGVVAGLSVPVEVNGRPYGVLSVHRTELRPYDATDAAFLRSLASLVGLALERRAEKRRDERTRRDERLAAIGRFASEMTHEFGHLISVVKVYAELLEESPRLGPEDRAHLGHIAEHAERAAALTAEMLDFARGAPVQLAPLDLGSFVDRLAQDVRGVIPDTIDLSVRRAPATYLVSADAGRLEQAVLNLVSNASDAMPGGGELVLALSTRHVGGRRPSPVPGMASGAWHVLEVCDTGAGIPCDLLPRVFEPFVSSKPARRGTGLGLAVVYSTVEKHGGHVDIQSSQDRGTKVAVWLPGIEGGQP